MSRTSAANYLPSRPLADAVHKKAGFSDLGTVCARAGIPERVVARWASGELSGYVDVGLADQVMTRLGLFWWDVWTQDTVREPMFVVTTYRNSLKAARKGEGRKMMRLKVRTVPYGDLGADFFRLRQIEALMCGQLVGVAA